MVDRLDGERIRPVGLFSAYLRLAVTLLLLSAVGLILWPVEPRGAPGSTADARAMAGTLGACFTSGSESNRGRPGHHRGGGQRISGRVSNRTARPCNRKAFGLAFARSTWPFSRENFVVLILANWGPLSLSYEIKTVPSVKPAAIRDDRDKSPMGTFAVARARGGLDEPPCCGNVFTDGKRNFHPEQPWAF